MCKSFIGGDPLMSDLDNKNMINIKAGLHFSISNKGFYENSVLFIIIVKHNYIEPKDDKLVS